MMGVPESPLNSRRDLKVFDLIALFPFTYKFTQMLGYYIKKALVKAHNIYNFIMDTLREFIFCSLEHTGWKHIQYSILSHKFNFDGNITTDS